MNEPEVITVNGDYRSEKGMRFQLAYECSRSTQAKVAKRYGFSAQFINDVLKGRRDVTADLAERMGYQLVTLYRRKRAA